MPRSSSSLYGLAGEPWISQRAAHTLRLPRVDAALQDPASMLGTFFRRAHADLLAMDFGPLVRLYESVAAYVADYNRAAPPPPAAAAAIGTRQVLNEGNRAKRLQLTGAKRCFRRPGRPGQRRPVCLPGRAVAGSASPRPPRSVILTRGCAQHSRAAPHARRPHGPVNPQMTAARSRHPCWRPGCGTLRPCFPACTKSSTSGQVAGLTPGRAGRGS